MKRCKVVFTKRQVGELLNLGSGVTVTGFTTSLDPDYLSVFLDVEHLHPSPWENENSERVIIKLEEVQRDDL